MKADFKVESINHSEARAWIVKRHYAKRTPVGRSFAILKDGVIQGICMYSSIIPNVAASICGIDYVKQTIELSRLIVNDKLTESEKNITSWFISQTFKLLKKPKIIMSYSDTNQGHHGYIYQALNFIYTGQGGDSREFIIDGKQVSTRPEGLRKQMKLMDDYDPNLTIAQNVEKIGGEVIKLIPKHRYIHFLGTKAERKAMRKALRFPVKPYPKGDNTRYFASQEIKTQVHLF